MSNDSRSHVAGKWSTLRHDALASVVVFLVALPLCMGIAIASGAPVAAGLISGIVGGIVVGSLAGCPLQVSGPAAGLTVIVYDVIQRFGLEMLGMVVLLAGLLQVAAGLLKLGQWFRAVSPAVIQGMLAGIGILILASQFHVMIDDAPKGTGAQNLASIPQAIWKSIGVPQLDDRQIQRVRVRTLRDVGELRRRQVVLEERLHEILPREQLRADENPAVPASASGAYDRLVRQQAALSQELSAIVNDRVPVIEPADGDQRNGKISAAAATAVRHAQAALTALEERQIELAFESQVEVVASLEALLSSLKNHHVAAHIGVITILILVGWQSLTPRKWRVVPAPLVAVVVATIGATVLVLPVLYVEVPDNLLQEVHFPVFSAIGPSWKALLQAALLMAIVASAETLLCAAAVDQMQTGPRTNYDRELLAQGIGNSVCGMLGALPLTGVIVRSSANVQAGGQTRFSAILHGAWLLLFVAVLAFLLRLIPTASLAAILVYTGYKLVNLKAIKKLRQYGWGEVGIYAATVATIVLTDLLTGVVVGIVLSAAKLLYTFSHLSASLETDTTAQQAVLRLHGAATFVRLPRLAAELERVPRGVELHVDFEHLDYIDHACLDLLMTWARQHESTGGNLVIDWASLHARFHGEAGSASNRQPSSRS